MKFKLLPILSIAISAVIFVVSCSSEPEASAPENPNLSEYSKGILEDGEVTRAEVDEARQRTVSCIELEGYSAEFIAENDRISLLSIEAELPDDEEEQKAFEEKMASVEAECKTEFLNDIEKVWLINTQPSEEETAAAFNELKECAATYDITLDAPTPESILPLLEHIDDQNTEPEEREELSTCFNKYSLATATGE